MTTLGMKQNSADIDVGDLEDGPLPWFPCVSIKVSFGTWVFRAVIHEELAG